MSGEDMSLLYAFYQLEPFGPSRGGFDTGLLCSVVAGSAGAKNVAPRNFMPYARADRFETQDDVDAMNLRIAQAMAGRGASGKER